MKYLNQFNIELQKLAATGIVGDILTGAFVGQLGATIAHHAKGFKEALRAGATLKEATGYHPLPLGGNYKFTKLTPKNRTLKFDFKSIKSPYRKAEESIKYEKQIDKEVNLAKTFSMPAAAAIAIGIDRKKHNDKKKNNDKNK